MERKSTLVWYKSMMGAVRLVVRAWVGDVDKWTPGE